MGSMDACRPHRRSQPARSNGLALAALLLTLPVAGCSLATRGERPSSVGPERPVAHRTPGAPTAERAEGERTLLPTAVPARVVEIEATHRSLGETPPGLILAEPPREGHERQQRKVPPRTPDAAETAAARAPAVTESSALVSSFESTDFDDNGTQTGFLFIPPDPMGAAGPNHVVNAVNVLLRIHAKDGTLQAEMSLADFFADLGPLTETFDPKVLYDEHSDRWLVVALDQTLVAAGDPQNTSRILLAVSDDSDPNGSWTTTAINSVVTSGSKDHWADYPGFAVDEEAVYVTANLFTFDTFAYGGVRLWTIDKGEGSGGFYDGGAAGVTILNPYVVEGIATTTQPAVVRGSAPAGIGTWLVSYSGLTDGTNEFLQVVRVDDPLGAPVLTHEFLATGNLEPLDDVLPDAPQAGSAYDIETNDRRALEAVWRDDSLWMTATICPGTGADADQATAHWWEIDTTVPDSLLLADLGAIGGEEIATGTHTFFPSIDVTPYGHVVIGFSASAATIFPGAYWTTRLASDPAGATAAPDVLRAGLDSYLRTFGDPDVDSNRWGDYTGVSLDPADGTVWIYNEFASSQGSPTGSEDGRWATVFGRICVGAEPTATISSPADGAVYADTDLISFVGTATDLEDGSLTSGLAWSSNLDGVLGSGGSFSTLLTAGQHTVTAQVSDSCSFDGVDAVAVTVTSADCPVNVTISSDVTDTQVVRAVGSIGVQGITVTGSGDLTLIAGDSISFASGFVAVGPVVAGTDPAPCAG